MKSGVFRCDGRVPRCKDRLRVSVDFSGGGRTKQEFRDECDINRIMARYEKTGMVSHVNKYQGEYGDFTGAVDFHGAQNLVVKATEMFLSLPAKVRERFGHEPAVFLDFVSDPKNKEEMAALGLLKPPAAAQVVPAPPKEANKPAKEPEKA